jgi:hypothetical protein
MNELASTSTARTALTLTLSQRERGYKRRAFKVLLFLLAGAIINVAVAWGCASRAPVWWGRSTSSRHWPETIWGEKEIYERNGYKQTWIQKVELDEPLERPEGGVIVHKTRLLEQWVVEQAGWPMLSMGSRQFDIRDKSLYEPDVPVRQRLIRLRPRFPGFAINTIFYAAIVSVLFAVPGAVRRRVRRKRGQCVACGYSLRDNVSEKCPECGAAASRSLNCCGTQE